MKKRLMSLLLALTLCAAVLCVPAFAAEKAEATPDPGAPTRMWGQLTRVNDKSFSLKSTNQGMEPEVILHVTDDTLYLDAVSGLPVKTDSIKDGQTVYVYTSPAMATSLPPQTTGLLFLLNIPADYAVPSYYTVTKVSTATSSGVQVTTDQGTTVDIPKTATFFPYLTKNIVGLENIQVGSRILVWSDAKNVVTRVMIFPSAPLASFTDMKEGDAHYASVQYAVRNRLMTGATETTFDPNGGMTRANVAVALWQAAGAPAAKSAAAFSDMKADADYAGAVAWAAENNLVKGYKDGTFAPDRTITREQLATILYRYEQLQGGGFKGAWMFLLDFTDRDAISPSSYEGVAWCVMHNILKGQNGVLSPKTQVTRAQAATMLMRYLTLDKTAVDSTPSDTAAAK